MQGHSRPAARPALVPLLRLWDDPINVIPTAPSGICLEGHCPELQETQTPPAALQNQLRKGETPLVPPNPVCLHLSTADPPPLSSSTINTTDVAASQQASLKGQHSDSGSSPCTAQEDKLQAHRILKTF